MNDKLELKKQLIILSSILILVIIIAIIVNTGKIQEDTTNNVINNQSNSIQDNRTDEQKLLDNLKGLLEEPEDEEEYIQDETQGTQENIITTENGETVIIRE